MKARIDARRGPDKICLTTSPKTDRHDFEHDDLQHLSPNGTARVIDHYDNLFRCIPKSVGDKTRGNLRIQNGEHEAAERRQSRVTTSYPFGCRTCCRIGHAQNECPSNFFAEANPMVLLDTEPRNIQIEIDEATARDQGIQAMREHVQREKRIRDASKSPEQRKVQKYRHSLIDIH